MNLRFFILFFFYFNFLFSQNLELSYLSIPDSLTKNANSVIRSYNKEIQLESSKKMIIKVSKSVTVLNKLGSHESKLVLHYDKNKKIKSLKAIFYDGFGKEIKSISKNKFEDYASADGISLHNDGRLKSYKYIPTSYPYTFLYEYEVETSTTAFIPSWFPINSYYQSIENSSFSISYAQGLILQKLERNFNDFNIKKESTENTYTFSLANQVASRYEEYSPSFINIFPSVKFASNKFHLEGYDGTANNWNDFGKWMYSNLLAPRGDLSESTQNYVKNMVKGIEDPIEKARMIYEYVQNKTRYISVQVGIGGWMPMLSSEVDRLGYGDCKALTYYTKSLMDAAGVESYYTAVNAGPNKRDIEKDIVSVQGNHVFLYVPSEEKDYWLECTSQDVPFGYQGRFTDDRDVLIISDKESKIVHSPSYDVKNSLQLTSANYFISEDGNIKASVKIESSGLQYNDHFRIDKKNERERNEHYKEDYWPYLNNLSIKKSNFTNNKNEIIFTEDLEIIAENYASINSSRMLIPLNPFNRYTSIIKRYRNRKHPLYIARGFYDKDEFILNLPEGYSIEAIPENVKIDNSFGSYSIEMEKLNDNQIKYSRTLTILKGKHPKEEYNNFRKFKRKIAKLDNSKIVLLKN